MTPWDTLNTEELSSVGNVPQKLFFGNDMIFRTKQIECGTVCCKP